MKNVQVLANKVVELLSEIETYSFYKANLVRSLNKLFDDYQKGKYTYFQYERIQNKLLKGKTKEEWINYYNAYILSLLKKVEAYNSQIFFETYNDTGYVKMEMKRPVPRPVHRPVPKPAPKEVAKPAVMPVPEEKPEMEPKPERIVIEKPVVMAKPEVKHAPEAEPVKAEEEVPEVKLVEVRPSIIDKVSLFFKHIFVRKEVEERIEEIKAAKPEKHVKHAKPVKHPAKPVAKPLAKPVTKHVEPEGPGVKLGKILQPKPEKKQGLVMGEAFGLNYFRNLLSRRKPEFTEDKSEIPLSTIQLETLRRKAQPEISAQIEKITATALTKEASRIKSIMEKRKALKIYQPSFFGAVANIAIKKLSLFLLDQFPEFFKDLYHALRLANIKVLSNTYVNMMVLGVMGSSFFGLFLFGFFFSSTALPITQIIFRTVMMSLLLGLATFAGFYSYPYSKMKQRRRSINTNLPFAINHMAAVSSSGVSPVRMFNLISESKEYGEVSVEIEKVVNYIDIFGYDILTALKAVAATTPSYQFKDFFEGMISTTQTGGDLKAYFAQKSEESMLNYKLERQKYTETISTYSDIYTGILIAAPLFFVAALSLVSLLGGKVGGMNVNIIIVLGTYVIIPFMNIAFLTFLEVTQPEI